MIYRLPESIIKLIPKEVFSGDCGICISHEGYALSFGSVFVMKLEDDMFKTCPDITIPFSAFNGLVGFIYLVKDDGHNKHAIVCSRVQIIDMQHMTGIVRKCNWFTPLKPREMILSEIDKLLQSEEAQFTVPATTIEAITALSKDNYDYITFNIKDDRIVFTLFSETINKSKFKGSIAYAKRRG